MSTPSRLKRKAVTEEDDENLIKGSKKHRGLASNEQSNNHQLHEKSENRKGNIEKVHEQRNHDITRFEWQIRLIEMDVRWVKTVMGVRQKQIEEYRRKIELQKQLIEGHHREIEGYQRTIGGYQNDIERGENTIEKTRKKIEESNAEYQEELSEVNRHAENPNDTVIGGSIDIEE